MNIIEEGRQKLSNKKILRNQIEEQLETALQALKETLGEKRFKKRIRRARKLFLKGV
jgi:hypothetical protein